ncbi:hypothetical protein ABTX35_34280 [Streptomyces sp. NPDC096080]|uniref:hypothetical protein n=1 Tax=Streptomyces sp. NPDC096080 TaxID=3156693 RepID=UPI00331B79D1
MDCCGCFVAGRGDRPPTGTRAPTRAGAGPHETSFPQPDDAARRAVGRAAGAGHEGAGEPLLDVPASDADPLAENLFFPLLDRLGVVPL